MSSTAVEFGLINTLRTGNVLVDTLACMLVPLLIQKIVTHLQTSQESWTDTVYYWFFPPVEQGDQYVERLIEVTQQHSSNGRIWDQEQKNHLLQKAISLYLADVLDLSDRSAVYQLMTKPKKKKNKNNNDDQQEQDQTSNVSTDDSDDEYEDDDQDDYYGCSVAKLSVESLPRMDEWIDVIDGVLFQHRIVAAGDSSEADKGVKEAKMVYTLRSYREDGANLIDAFVTKAFARYQANERRKYREDKTRYLLIQSNPSMAAGSDDAGGVRFKRYALGEEKTFENLFFDGKQQVLQLLDNFANRTGKFAIKGFPYKLGLLLHGPPGTGKTSLIKAVAQYTKRHIVTISLGKIKTNQELMDALFDLEFDVKGLDWLVELSFEDVVFVMEDIDCASSVVNSREKETTAGNANDQGLAGGFTDAIKDNLMEMDCLNLSGLLNVLDGVIDCPGRIVIMTTNHPEKLDPALIRPGRVNKKLLLSHMRWTHIQEMVEYYCQAKLTAEQMAELEAIITSASHLCTPAEVEEVCAEHNEVQDVLDGLRVLAAA